MFEHSSYLKLKKKRAEKNIAGIHTAQAATFQFPESLR